MTKLSNFGCKAPDSLGFQQHR